MSLKTTTATMDGILPDAYAELVKAVVLSESVALQVFKNIQTDAHTTHVPVLTGDVQAVWAAEGAELTASDATLGDIPVTPAKVGATSILSNELVADSDPAAAALVGESVSRDIARKVDAAAFGNLATPAPKGLESLTTGTVDAGTAFASLDPFLEAQSQAELQGAQLSAFVANPADALTLAKLKTATDSNMTLLQADPTMPTRRLIAGVPLYVSSAVTAGTVWGIPGDRCVAVIRNATQVAVSEHERWSTDESVVKATMRVGLAFPHPLAVQAVSTSAA